MNDNIGYGRDTKLYKLLMPVIAGLLRRYYRTANDEFQQDDGSQVFHVPATGEVETTPIDASETTFEQDADGFIMELVVSMFTGTYLTEARAAKVWFILDFCYSIAKRAIYQVLKGSADNFTETELVWLVWAQVETRMNLRNNKARWMKFQNELNIKNLDEG